jgi:hypothetical protein
MHRRMRRTRHGWQVFGLAGPHPCRVYLMAAASQPRGGQCYWQLSFLHTAAGQSRTRTGFPLAAHQPPAPLDPPNRHDIDSGETNRIADISSPLRSYRPVRRFGPGRCQNGAIEPDNPSRDDFNIATISTAVNGGL